MRAYSTNVHIIEGKQYLFSRGDLYEHKKKNEFRCVDHVYNEKYKRIGELLSALHEATIVPKEIPPLRKTICKYCKAEFETFIKEQKYCDKLCKSKAKSRITPPITPTKG